MELFLDMEIFIISIGYLWKSFFFIYGYLSIVWILAYHSRKWIYGSLYLRIFDIHDKHMEHHMDNIYRVEYHKTWNTYKMEHFWISLNNMG